MIFSAPRTRGFTLIEVIVTLAVIGIALAVVAPSLILRQPEPGLSEVLTASRRAALRRGESMTVTIDADGNWRVSPSRSLSETLNSGSIAPLGSVPSELLISPLGVCTVRRGRISPNDSFNPLTCTVARPGNAR